jgi:hypothetical protein
MCWQVGNSGPLPFNTDVYCSNQAISVFIYDKKMDRLEHSTQSLSIAHIMVNGDRYAPY